jgi:hypothetical protein
MSIYIYVVEGDPAHTAKLKIIYEGQNRSGFCPCRTRNTRRKGDKISRRPKYSQNTTHEVLEELLPKDERYKTVYFGAPVENISPRHGRVESDIWDRGCQTQRSNATRYD